jgi:O-antigen ligase
MGSGLRGFAEHYGQGFSYPHNLFLHAASEGGIGALILLLVVFVWFARRVLHRPHSPLTLVYIAAASAIFTSAMFSGDYYDNRFLWVFMIIAIRVTEVPEGATDSMTTTSRANEHMTTDRRPQ